MRKLRLTGGEPLLRRELERLVAMLAELPDVDVTMTTNGALLARKAQALADAGLARVTVSLDSLDEDVFRAMNDVDVPLAQVLDGIDAAAAAGLPVKVNTVVKRGLNDDGIVALASGSAAPATSCASSSSWTSAPRTAGGSTTSSPQRRSSSGSAPSSRSSRSSRTTAARPRAAGATRTAAARSA